MLSFIWNSDPIMYSVFTVVFLCLIRLWSRYEEPKCVKKLGKEISDKADDLIEGLSSDEPAQKTDRLDALFYGELFIAGVLAGAVIKYLK